MADIKILEASILSALDSWLEAEIQVLWLEEHTLTPSSEKHGGTAGLSSSASARRVGNFSTADIGMSPR